MGQAEKFLEDACAEISARATTASKAGVLDRLARRLLLARLEALEIGCLEWWEGGRKQVFGKPCAAFPEPVQVYVLDPGCYAHVAFGGAVGAGEAYIKGLWRCDRLTDLLRLMLRNRAVLDSLDSGAGRLAAPMRRVFHWLHRNTPRGSRRNIRAHYDLGNDFFKLFLDDTLTYSSGYFAEPGMSLREASVAKLDRICRQLELGPDDHVLEIGTGWGSFAIHAARRYGCRVTTTTISDAQYHEACARVAAAGLADQITLLRQDFRDLEGRFDKIASIEMIEAVGEENIGAFFATCEQCLKPGGRLAVQAITISEQQFPSYRKGVDFIQRYVFPGGFLPTVGLLSKEAGAHSDLRLLAVDDMGLHYAETLRQWRANLNANREAIRALGYDESFLRLWEFYLCYCEAGFAERATGVVQMAMIKP